MKAFFSLALVCLPAFATADSRVEVLDVKPRFVTQTHQVCEQVVQQEAQSTNTAGGILGAIAGAALGNQVGGGSGKTIATAAGAVIGYEVGKGQPGSVSSTPKTLCKDVSQTVQAGEVVTFRYKGKVFSHTFEE